MFEPSIGATLIIKSLNEPPVGGQSRSGIIDIPRLHEGGVVVVVFDEVNIRLRPPSRPTTRNNPEDMQNDLHDQIGKAGQFLIW
jgi:hypothetical protein